MDATRALESQELGLEIPAHLKEHLRLIPGGAGHGPARAYGYIAVASAFGIPAKLTKGGTRSTAANPLEVTVHTDDVRFAQLNEVYDIIAPEAEKQAAGAREAARMHGGRFYASYRMSLLTRAFLGGFLLGAASVIAGPGMTVPVSFRDSTRARMFDEAEFQTALLAGREWTSANLTVPGVPQHPDHQPGDPDPAIQAEYEPAPGEAPDLEPVQELPQDSPAPEED